MEKLDLLSVEQQVLKIFLQDPSLVDTVKLKPSEFSTAPHSQIFSAINNLINKGEAVDPLAVAEECEKTFSNAHMKYIIDLFENCWASAENIQKHAQSITRAATKRSAVDIATRLLNTIQLSDDMSCVDTAIRQLMAVEQGDVDYECDINPALTKTLERLDRLHRGEEEPGLDTGLEDLNEKIGGFQKERLYVFAGRPGKGKSALALNFARTMIKNKVPSIFYSCEMSREEICKRLIAIAGSVKSMSLTTGKFDEDEWAKLSAAVTALQDGPFSINDEPGISINDLMRSARRAKQLKNIEIIFVDYIQIVESMDSRLTVQEQVKEVVWSLKKLARELKIPVVALAQLNREADKLDGPAGMAYIAGASAVEKDSDYIGTLYSDEVMERNGHLIVHTCKNRNGPKNFDLKTSYERNFFRISDIPTSSANYGY